MRPWGILLLATYGIVGAIAGITGVAILLLVSVAGLAVMFGADALHTWRESRR